MAHPDVIPDGVRRDIITRYHSGESAQQIADKLHIARRSVYNIIHASGVKTQRTMNSLSEGQELEIVERYSRGESVRSISRDFTVHLQTIHNMLKRRGVASRTPKPRVREEVRAQIVDAVKSGSNVPTVRRDLGVSEATVTRVLRAARAGGDVVEMLQGRPRFYEIDDTAFDKNTPESLYWKGFLYADGHVTPSEDGSPRLIVGLAEKDLGHLLLLRDFLKSTHPIRVVQGLTALGGPTAYFSARSKRLCAALNEGGLTTHRPLPPSDDLARSPHFWRGAVDGDGWVGMSENKGKLYPYIGLSGRLPVIETYQNYLSETFSIDLSIRPTESGVYRIDANGSTAETLVRAFYGNATVALERKLKRARVILSGEYTKFAPYEEAPSRVPIDGVRYLIDENE